MKMELSWDKLVERRQSRNNETKEYIYSLGFLILRIGSGFIEFIICQPNNGQPSDIKSKFVLASLIHLYSAKILGLVHCFMWVGSTHMQS